MPARGGHPATSTGTTARRPTMSDVAALAGVSKTTVSFVLNDSSTESIGARTRERVLAAVERLGYRPNRAAQGLRTRQSATIGFVADEPSIEPVAGLVSGAQELAWQRGRLLLIAVTMRDRAVLRAAIEELHDRQVDLAIVAAAGTRSITLPDGFHAVPTVLLNCFQPGGGVPTVLPDEASGGAAAAQAVIEAGHTDVVMLAGKRGSWATRTRVGAYRDAMRRAGVPAADLDIRFGNFHIDSGYQLTKQVLTRRPRPTAVLYGNDRMALGGYLAVAEAGLRIPDDISMVGYDDQDVTLQEVVPALTTVRLPFTEMGRAACQLVLGGDLAVAPARTLLPCPLVERGSVGPPPRQPATKGTAALSDRRVSAVVSRSR